MSENSVRGAGTARAGATDTTMLIWKVIAANPGITYAELWEQVEHRIPAGYAQRRYVRYRETSGSGGATGGGSRIAMDSGVLLSASRRYVLTHALRGMCKSGTLVLDGTDGRYTVARQPRYAGNSDAIDHTGTKAAEHMAVAAALRVAEKALSRPYRESRNGAIRTRELYDAVGVMVQALRAKGSSELHGGCDA